MTYTKFKERVKQAGWTLAELRCDVPPSDAILAFIGEVGKKYETYVLRFEERAS